MFRRTFSSPASRTPLTLAGAWALCFLAVLVVACRALTTFETSLLKVF